MYTEEEIRNRARKTKTFRNQNWLQLKQISVNKTKVGTSRFDLKLFESRKLRSAAEGCVCECVLSEIEKRIFGQICIDLICLYFYYLKSLMN